MAVRHACLAPLLQAVQDAKLFDDSKTIVDMPLRSAPTILASAFHHLQLPDLSTDPETHLETLLEFVEEHFHPVESDLVQVQLPLPAADHITTLPNVQDLEIQQWVEYLHSTWYQLYRAPEPGVKDHPELHSLIWVPHPFIVPGARFREIYYWDSYWVMKGLLVSGLDSIAKGIVLNMAHLIEQHGFMPNGIRTYYLNRSQPPLLSQMVRLVYSATQDLYFLQTCLAALLKEHQYWINGNKAVRLLDPNTVGHEAPRFFTLSRFWADWEAPRPESFREDSATAGKAGFLTTNSAEAKQLYRNLASAAESGWDFSSRWLADGVSLETCRTTDIIPADLNGFLYQMECNIAEFANILGNVGVAEEYKKHAKQRLEAIQALMWDESSGQWRDLVLPPQPAIQHTHGNTEQCTAHTGVHQNPATFASNFIPLYCGCAAPGSSQAAAAAAALSGSGLLQPGGIATTLKDTKQQWDWPNAWPSIQCMLVEGLSMYAGPEGSSLAAEIAARYLRTAYEAWRVTGRMFEKFDATRVGVAGGGGEYEVVHGFGWTNGVALYFLKEYGWQE